jgi:hypothetical protein
MNHKTKREVGGNVRGMASRCLLPVIAISIGVLSAGCASTPIPADKLSRSTAAVRSAEEMNAERVPSAAVHLRLARTQMKVARRLLENGDNKEAGYLLLRAEADAEVAMNLAREAAAKQDAIQTIQAVRSLRAQLEVPPS